MMILNRIYIITPLELEPLLTKVVSPTVSRLLETLHFFFLACRCSFASNVTSRHHRLYSTNKQRTMYRRLPVGGLWWTHRANLEKAAPDEKVWPLNRADYRVESEVDQATRSTSLLEVDLETRTAILKTYISLGFVHYLCRYSLVIPSLSFRVSP